MIIFLKPYEENMQSKIKLTALATALCACGFVNAQSAAPSVTVFGIVDAGISSTTNTGNGSQTTSGAVSSILGVSAIGFKGDKDLGDGLTGFFNFMVGFNPTTGKLFDSSTLFSRNAYIGLSSSMGSVSIGRQWDLNDDWLVGSVFKGGYNAGAVFKFSEFDAVSDLYNNTIKYVTPVSGGFQGAAMYGSNIGGSSTPTTAGSLTNIGVKYAAGPLMVAGTYFTEASTTSTSSTYKLTTLGASYASGAVKGRLGYATATTDGGVSYVSLGPVAQTNTANVVDVGVDYSVTPQLTLSLDQLARKNTTLNNSSNITRFLAMYAWKPNTTLVFNVANLSNSTTATESLLATEANTTGGGYAGKSQQAIAAGVRFSF